MTATRAADEPRDPTRPWAPTPFGRLARAHALSVSGDAMFTAAMAGLVFFNVTNLDQARWQVAAALLFTIVPFSLAAPFIGPLIDRAKGGRKWMVVALAVLRALVALALAWNRENPFLLYPEFTLVLVFGKGHTLARGALVPATVKNDDELVKANSKLSAISGVAAVAGGAVALVAMWVCSVLGLDQGPSVALFLGAVCYVFCSIEAAQLPSVRVAPAPPDATETAELHGPGIRAAGIAVSTIRVVVGFLTFLLAFHFKDLEATDSWGSKVGLVGAVVTAQLGFLVGSFVAVRVRRVVIEEQMVLAALAAIALGGFLTAFMSELAAAVLLSFAVGLASNAAKQAFDSIVQRDAPDANQGRAFARFETHFQLFWVIGALVPVVVPTVVPISPNVGYLVIALGCTAGAVWFFLARRRLLAEGRRRPMPFEGEPELVEPRPISRAFLRHRRGAGGPDTEVMDLGPDPAAGDGPLPPPPPPSSSPPSSSPLEDLIGATDRTMVLPEVGTDGPLPPPPSAGAGAAHDPTTITEAWPPPGPPAPFDHADHDDDDGHDDAVALPAVLDATVVEPVPGAVDPTIVQPAPGVPVADTDRVVSPSPAGAPGGSPLSAPAAPTAPPRWTGRPGDALDASAPPRDDDNRWVAPPSGPRHDPITDDHDRPVGWPVGTPGSASPSRSGGGRPDDDHRFGAGDDVGGHPFVASAPSADRPLPSPDDDVGRRPRPTSRRRAWAPPAARADDDVYGLPSDAAYFHRPGAVEDTDPPDDDMSASDAWAAMGSSTRSGAAPGRDAAPDRSDDDGWSDPGSSDDDDWIDEDPARWR